MKYEKPSVETFSAREVVESLGPAQAGAYGASGGGGSHGISPAGAVGGTGGTTSVSRI